MGLYDALKDAVNLAQKADNIELYRQLLDVSAQALDLQAEVARLREENALLKKRQDVAQRIVRHKEPVVTLLNEEPKLYYCAHCWDSEQLLIQVNCYSDAYFTCTHCKTKGSYDDAARARREMNISALL